MTILHLWVSSYLPFQVSVFFWFLGHVDWSHTGITLKLTGSCAYSALREGKSRVSWLIDRVLLQIRVPHIREGRCRVGTYSIKAIAKSAQIWIQNLLSQTNHWRMKYPLPEKNIPIFQLLKCPSIVKGKFPSADNAICISVSLIRVTQTWWKTQYLALILTHRH